MLKKYLLKFFTIIFINIFFLHSIGICLILSPQDTGFYIPIQNQMLNSEEPSFPLFLASEVEGRFDTGIHYFIDEDLNLLFIRKYINPTFARGGMEGITGYYSVLLFKLPDYVDLVSYLETRLPLGILVMEELKFHMSQDIK